MMEDTFLKIILERANEVDTWVFICLLIIAIARKEFVAYTETKKSKDAINNTNNYLRVLVNRYSNALSKDTSVLLVKVIYNNAFSNIMIDIIRLSLLNKSMIDLKQSLTNQVKIINDEQMQVLQRFTYNGLSFDNYIPKEVLENDMIMKEVDRLNLKDMDSVINRLNTKLTMSLNKAIEKL